MKKLNFRVSAGLKNIIGKELITNEVVAVFELVKNSYDAGSKNVKIVLDIISSELKIMDTGNGMSYQDLVDKWLFVAYSEKKDSDREDGKAYVGAKGIGRFACDRLGKITHVYSKKESDKLINHLSVDWSSFEKNTSDDFTTIDANYEAMVDKSILLDEKAGTTIVISDLSDQWDHQKIKRLKDSISKLINPFTKNNSFSVQIEVVSLDASIKKYSGEITNDILSVLEDKTISISAKFEDKLIIIELKDRGNSVYKLTKTCSGNQMSGVTISVYFLNRSAKVIFKKRMGIDAVNYGNVFIYKNDFRVYPYGEEGFDGFGLDKRKAQGYKRYLGSREILGGIDIVDRDNRFIEVSSRDKGFIENIYTILLKEYYFEYVHKPLEKYILLVKWGYDKTNDQEISYRDVNVSNINAVLPQFAVSEEFNIEINEELLDKIKPNLEKRIDAITSQEESSVDVKEVKDVLALTKEKIREKDLIIVNQSREKDLAEKQLENLEKQNRLLKNLTERELVLQAEITHHISKSANNLRAAVDNIVSKTRDLEILNNLLVDLSSIRVVASKLNVFNEIVLKGNFHTKSKSRVNLYEYFDFYVNNSSNVLAYSRSLKITLWLDNNSTSVVEWNEMIDVYDISVLIDNMISNVFDLDGSFFDIKFTRNGNREIIFYSDTPHVLDYDKQRIFNLGYSTKTNGTGIGLYHIKEIVENCDWQIEVHNVLNGVEFRIILREGKQ